MKKSKVISTTFLSTVVLIIAGFSLFLYLGHYSLVKNVQVSETRIKKEDNEQTKPSIPAKQTIYPTIYITGSGGSIKSLNILFEHILPIKTAPAKRGLTLLVNISENDKLTTTGKIAKGNKYPLIQLGTVVGTSNGALYSPAIQTAVRYLKLYYNVPWINLVGYSSGATGAMYYMIDTGGNTDFPPVNKFVSLDGEFNNCVSQVSAGQTLADVLLEGPEIQKPMYQYIEQGYQKVSPTTKIMLLEGDYKTALQTDGAVPWSDSFSIYHLLKANGNEVSATLYPSKTSHGSDTSNLIATSYIRNFIYGDG
ncbi:alpha/beta hydrolase [Lactococcus nasutitermitis]|uniref:Alpha/beta hydrolase n=1 Tax=Lactococcus nasutitermitis TaxID=1652957 RepID=A0ABV9JF22_9LACT|nr:alpha/beta hydrolase [Lactococcus nasutitermitis]